MALNESSDERLIHLAFNVGLLYAIIQRKSNKWFEDTQRIGTPEGEKRGRRVSEIREEKGRKKDRGGGGRGSRGDGEAKDTG